MSTEDAKLTEMAATGFNTAIRLLSYKLKCTEDEAIERVALFFQRDPIQIQQYRRTGIQPRMIERFLDFLKAHDVAFGVHQLKPTKKMLAMQKWSEEDAAAK